MWRQYAYVSSSRRDPPLVAYNITALHARRKMTTSDFVTPAPSWLFAWSNVLRSGVASYCAIVLSKLVRLFGPVRTSPISVTRAGSLRLVWKCSINQADCGSNGRSRKNRDSSLASPPRIRQIIYRVASKRQLPYCAYFLGYLQ